MRGEPLLAGKVAIVTGAGRGIGRAIARRLAASGARLIINDIDEISARDSEAMIEQAGGEGCGGRRQRSRPPRC